MVAKVPRWAATLLTVGAGPRSYGLAAADGDCADAGWIATSAVIRPVTAASTAAFKVTVLLLLWNPFGRVRVSQESGTSMVLVCIVLFLHAFVVVAGVAPNR
ncbi:hypothetical protein [Streptomyces sp. NBC_00199]|uniref:hypothetical protein n=1 Tax=Streptomyces sp. NBC_00199 TaxID=2975678 RepID=UPI00224E0B9A|nr:hypothetical protein [Streptomyces sp. NBC_00199]MCX5262585.1 hypothetical protein [Streptomyces sp. NBC_00199]